ncbi:outer membrane beta-barrel protein [Parapedobacter sp. 10938]|uniref:outer membrane beta-barrel protein n=1 Tax=Parapedobacter flavus TaxID=3110225 RepID=UPI002DB7FA55|nr:outer membrane beta-barrel protein [Parapedobacter sp. 10938]MEC3880405.1 outer membrane beta-barrel protein [Parapedobacter sp. 10938]
MKKLLLTLTAAAAVTFAANAQTEKGKTLLGGTVSYDYANVKDVDGNTQSFSIIPSVGVFVNDNVAVGLGIGYAWSQDDDGTDKVQSGEFSAAPFARLYKGDGNFKFFGQLSVPMGWGTSKANGDKIASAERYGVELAPGFAFFPTEKIGIEFSVKGLYYQNTTVTPEGGDGVSSNSFGLDASSFAPRIGIQFYF